MEQINLTGRPAILGGWKILKGFRNAVYQIKEPVYDSGHVKKKHTLK